MAKYFYIAKTKQGQTETGIEEAKDKFDLARILRERNLVLISATKEEEIKKKKLEISLPLFGVPITEKLMFTKNLQVMISAGVPLPQALKTLADQTKSKRFHDVLLEISEKIIKGKSFSESLVDYPDVFSELFCSMIEVGEESGTLEDSLKNLSRQIEREYDLWTKIKGALMYPTVIISAMIGIGILMLVMVVPKLAETFEELGIELPLTTRVVIFLATFLIERWYLVLLLLILIFIGFQATLKAKRVRKTFDNFTLKVPIVAPLFKKIYAARTIRTLSILIASGVPIVRSLEIVSATLTNYQFQKSLLEAKEKVRKGIKLSEALSSYQQTLYPPIVIQMVKVGEETGQTSEVLGKLADFFEEEVTTATKNLTAIVEPIIMLIIGGAVGFFAVSMIQPMYTMLGAL